MHSCPMYMQIKVIWNQSLKKKTTDASVKTIKLHKIGMWIIWGKREEKKEMYFTVQKTYISANTVFKTSGVQLIIFILSFLN